MSRVFPRLNGLGGPLALCSLMALTGCDENGQFVAMQAFQPATSVEGTPPPARRGKTVERDVEAPEVFSASEPGLWDGRPSLGGVWVAHPDVSEPERVIIRNVDNSKFVVGALFRRERDIPGPRLQISSDAAEALGILAGAPAELNVTALRKEVIEEEQPEEIAQTDVVAEPEEIAQTTLDPIAGAAAAIDAVDEPPVATTLPRLEPKETPEQIVPAAAAAPAPTETQLTKPFIQIGIFSVEANATRPANRMRDAGIIPLTRTYTREGKTFWRVVVGPATNSAERKTLLKKVKEEGFTDAYAVTN